MAAPGNLLFGEHHVGDNIQMKVIWVQGLSITLLIGVCKWVSPTHTHTPQITPGRLRTWGYSMQQACWSWLLWVLHLTSQATHPRLGDRLDGCKRRPSTHPLPGGRGIYAQVLSVGSAIQHPLQILKLPAGRLVFATTTLTCE